MAESITVYYNPMSPPSRAVIYFLDYIKNTTVKRQLVDLSTQEQLQPWFLEINPHHTVPALKDESNGVTLFESTAILQYLAEKLGVDGKYGLSKDDKERWSTINALANHSNFMAKANIEIMMNFYAPVFRGAPFSLDALKASVEKVKGEQFKTLENMLSKTGFIGATAGPTIADLRVWAEIFQISVHGDDQTTLAIVDFKDFPNIDKWLVAIKADIYDKEKWAPCGGFYKHAESIVGTAAWRIADKTE